MAHTKRRMSRAGIAAIACLSVSLSTLSPVGIANADSSYSKGVKPSDGAQQEYDANTDALHWGINEMFRGKATSFEAADGARYDADAQQFVFPYVSKDDDAKTVSYTGSVTILGECEDDNSPSRGTCDVDVTFTDPIVTVDTEGNSSISATVHSTKDGAEWFGPETVELATLDFSEARFNNEDPDTTWVDVAATATSAAEDNAFLGTGALEALEFTYPGETEEEAGTGPVTVEEITTAETAFNAEGALKTIRFDDGSVMQISRGYGDAEVAVFSPGLESVSDAVSLNVYGKYMLVADHAAKEVYWVNEDGEVLKGIVGDDGSITSSVITTLDENGGVTGFARQADGTLGVVLVPKYNTEPTYARFVEIDTDGNQTVTPLPAGKTIYPQIDDSSDYYTDQVWGSSYASTNTLGALPDGTWVFVNDNKLADPEDADNSVGSTPLHVTVDGGEATVAPFAGAADQYSAYQQASGLYVKDDIVAFFNGRNANPDRDQHPSLGFYRYADGELTPIYANNEADEYAVISGVAAQDDSLFVLSSANKTITRLSAADGSKQGSTVLEEANDFNEYGNYDYTNLFATGSELLASVPKNGDGYGDYHTLVATLATSATAGTAGTTADDSVERVTVGEYDADKTADSGKVFYGEKPVVAPVGQTGYARPMFITDDGEETVPEATYALEGDVPEGVTIDENNGRVTYAPTEEHPEVQNVKIRVTFTDGSDQLVGVPVKTVKVYDAAVKYPDLTTLAPGETVTVTPKLVGNEDGATPMDIPEDFTFELIEGAVSANSEGVSVDSDTGVVTYTAPADAEGTIYPRIQVTYPDGSVFNPSGPNFNVQEEPEQVALYIQYKGTETEVGKEVSTDAPTAYTLNGAANEDVPAGTTFKLVPPKSSYSDPQVMNFTIDENTGVVSITPTADQAGKTLFFYVEATYPDGSKSPRNGVGSVKVMEATDKTADSGKVFYGEKPVAAPVGQTRYARPMFITDDGEETVPEATYALEGDVPEGVTIDENNGRVTYAPTEEHPEVQNVKIRVTFTDGSDQLVGVPVKTVMEYVEQVSYPNPIKVAPGETGTSTPMLGGIEPGTTAMDVPEDFTFELKENIDGVSIDSDTGVITYTAPADASGTYYPMVTAVFPDGKRQLTGPILVVEDADSQEKSELFVSYSIVDAPAGKEVTLAPKAYTVPFVAQEIPAGTTFTFAEPGEYDSAQAPGFTIDENTGVVSFTPTADQVGKGLFFYVDAHYPDGTDSPRHGVGLVRVAEAATEDDNMMYNLIYPLSKGEAGSDLTATPFADMADTDDIEQGDIPAGTTFALDKVGNPEGASIDPQTGVVTYHAPAGSASKEAVVFSITATYADGTTDPTFATFLVTEPAPVEMDNAMYTPTYKPAVVKAGKTVSTTPTFDMTDTSDVEAAPAPADAMFELDANAPKGFSIDAKTGAVTYTADAMAPNATKEALVTVTYADKSTDEAVVLVGVKAAPRKSKPDTSGSSEGSSGSSEGSSGSSKGSSSSSEGSSGSSKGSSATGSVVSAALSVVSIGVFVGIIAALYHLFTTQFPGVFTLPQLPGMPRK